MKLKQIGFSSYMGKVKFEAIDEDGKKYIIENDEVRRIILEAFEKGSQTTLKPRQQYERLTAI